MSRHRRLPGADTERGLMFTATDTGYDLRAGAQILTDRFTELATCAHCGDIVAPSGKCLNVGDCRTADRADSRPSLARGSAASARSAPAAWNISGRVD